MFSRKPEFAHQFENCGCQKVASRGIEDIPGNVTVLCVLFSAQERCGKGRDFREGASGTDSLKLSVQTGTSGGVTAHQLTVTSRCLLLSHRNAAALAGMVTAS